MEFLVVPFLQHFRKTRNVLKMAYKKQEYLNGTKSLKIMKNLSQMNRALVNHPTSTNYEHFDRIAVFAIFLMFLKCCKNGTRNCTGQLKF